MTLVDGERVLQALTLTADRSLDPASLLRHSSESVQCDGRLAGRRPGSTGHRADDPQVRARVRRLGARQLRARGRADRRRRSRVEPDERRPGAQPLGRVGLIGDPAGRHEHELVARPRAQPPQHRERASASGAPDSPPAPAAATALGALRRPSREIVVFVAMMPSRPVRSARSATASTSSSERSGAIFTSSGTAPPAAAARPRRRDQRPQPRDRLQVAQPGRVGRADVDDEVVGVRRERRARWRGSRRRRPRACPCSCRCSRRRRRRDRGARASRAAAACAPALLKPMRLTSARSAGRRNIRGRGLPGCGQRA